MRGPELIQLADKWSGRKFAFKNVSAVNLETVGGVIALLKHTTQDQLDRWNADKVITTQSRDGFKYIQEALFSIRDDGSLGDPVEGAFLSHLGMPLENDDSLPMETRAIGGRAFSVADLVLDRDDVPFVRNWKGYYLRNWHPDFAERVERWVRNDWGEKADDILACATSESRMRFIASVSRHLYKAPYEMYSRYLGRRVPYKTGPETLRDIIAGHGGNCSEKAVALDMIRENFGIPGRLCLSGNDAVGEFPSFHLRRALERGSTMFTGRAQRFWEHYANVFEINGRRILADATGGPMPYLFCADSEDFFSQNKCLTVKFIAQEERFYYHDTSPDIAYDTVYNMEAFIPDIDLYHIFGPEEEDAPFGLLIRPDLWVCPNAYRGDEDFMKHTKEWNDYAESASRIHRLELYPTLAFSVEKKILTAKEQSDPTLIANLRAIETAFEKRCRYVWRDDRWRIGYVFCELEPRGESVSRR
ncbi:MAG: hypothetical protein GF344_16700 [Chitinivibrionales bacterium]|nr:hypothetical protein [Chitinivibrionales bacterium]MBD3358328.1 hypothetical protein [Chitinivibrionales bacterium]